MPPLARLIGNVGPSARELGDYPITGASGGPPGAAVSGHRGCQHVAASPRVNRIPSRNVIKNVAVPWASAADGAAAIPWERDIMDDDAEAAPGQAADGAALHSADADARLQQRFKAAFARSFAAAGQAPDSEVRLTVAQLAELGERMFLSGFSAAIDEIGR
jgi:hypothetical protein